MWTSDIGTTVFTRIKNKATSRLQETYPSITFTTSSSSSSEPKFPTVYIKRMQGAESGKDLEGTNVNAIVSTFQIEVTTNTGDTDAQKVADVVCEIMKSMRYEILGEPFADNTTNDISRNVARYQRVVGYGDVL